MKYRRPWNWWMAFTPEADRARARFFLAVLVVEVGNVQRACATAWGLRIAEKGDAS